MDSEIFLVLQKFSLEIIILAIIDCIICFLIKKNAPKPLKKFSLYYPYALGIVLYLIYVKISSTNASVVNMGITTGGVATIMLSFIKTQENKTSLADEVLKGIVSEKDYSLVREKIAQSSSQEEITDIISNYAVFSMTYDQSKVLAEIIGFEKNDN